MTFAPGSLVRSRGREWVVLPGGDHDLVKVRPLGGTQDEETGILATLENIEPARFPLPDPHQAGDFRSGRLLRDALRLGFRSTAGPFRSFGRIAVTPRPYQLVPLLMALKLDPVRLLIADDVGVGKTIESLLIARELIDQGDIQRMTVLCSPQLAEQWQREMETKFHIDAEVVLTSTVKKLERRLGPTDSLFDVYPFTVVSTDFIKSDRRRQEFLRACPELVIVDEAHTCVEATGSGRTKHQRYELLQGLTKDQTRHLILVTATPHSGKEEAFRNLLALLNDDLAVLPDDLSGPRHESDRRRLAQHFVQRRRADIRAYLDTETPFPERLTSEQSYKLSEPYRRFFDKVLAFARETVAEKDTDRRRQRVRYWSMLALLRSIASSPRAAAATLRNRAASIDTSTVEEADEVGRKTVLDQIDDDNTESDDVPPGAGIDPADDTPNQRRLRDYAREAESLEGPEHDHKLAEATKHIRKLLKDGLNPIVFCRYISTAEYAGEHLREALGKNVTVEVVTGALNPHEREARIETLSQGEGQRVLVCTDCLSEGINLQDGFDAVFHYDLAWNPTRHEQREGRVDRFGQKRPEVRTLIFYGLDNHIDGIVLDVLIRKHEAIRSSLGVSVPVPQQSDAVLEAITDGLLLRGANAEQLQLDLSAPKQELHKEWDIASEREKRSRTMFAQDALKPEDVAPELEAAQRALGGPKTVERFTHDALDALQASVVFKDGTITVNLTESPRQVRGLIGYDTFAARFDQPIAEGQLHLTRTHPVVENLATHVLDTALDELTDGIAARCGAVRTKALTTRTTLLLARFRFTLTSTSDDGQHTVIAEDARVLAFTGSPDKANWLRADQAQELLQLRPDDNIGKDLAANHISKVTEAWPSLEPHLNQTAEGLRDEFLDCHRRVRDAARRRGVRFDVEPHLPPDLLGIYVLLPVAKP